MQHEKFAERVVGRLTSVAEALEEEERRAGNGPASERANEIRVAAHMVRDLADVVTLAEEGEDLEPRDEVRYPELAAR